MPRCVTYRVQQIGTIRTPYQDSAPYQPVDADEVDCHIALNDEYVDGLNELGRFSYIYVLYYAHRVAAHLDMKVSPPWAGGKEVGVFSSRSPVRPNPIGLSVVRIKRIHQNRIYTSGLDVFDRTPLLDIKPYIRDLDSKIDANYGWIEDMNGLAHLILHIKGIPHDY